MRTANLQFRGAGTHPASEGHLGPGQRGDPLAPGDVRYYQAYYRDADAAFCAAPTGGTANTTNGVRVVW